MAPRLALIAACLSILPGAAAADGLYLPGLGASDPSVERPSYREAYGAFPPPQHNALGMPVAPPSPYDRPSYREAYDDFPPTQGRYGGGFVEYMITGGRMGGAVVDLPPQPEAAFAAPAPAPVYAAPTYAAPAYAATAPNAAMLPRSGLPDYAPDQPSAYYGGSAVGPQSMAVPLTATAQPAAYAVAPEAMNPAFQRQMVAYAGGERPGTIVIDTPNKFLYLVEGRGAALRYGIGVGRPGFAWAGVKTITRKAEWPDWTPPREMLARRPDLPRHMDGGEANPLGARALYLGSSLYRIHGTNEPGTIGTNVSSGCIRMMNQDVIDLYGRVRIGTRVVVL